MRNYSIILFCFYLLIFYINCLKLKENKNNIIGYSDQDETLSKKNDELEAINDTTNNEPQKINDALENFVSSKKENINNVIQNTNNNEDKNDNTSNQNEDIELSNLEYQIARNVCSKIVMKSKYFKNFCDSDIIFNKLELLKKNNLQLHDRIVNKSYEEEKDTLSMEVLDIEDEKKLLKDNDKTNPIISALFLFSKFCLGGVPVACANILKYENTDEIHNSKENKNNEYKEKESEKLNMNSLKDDKLDNDSFDLNEYMDYDKFFDNKNISNKTENMSNEDENMTNENENMSNEVENMPNENENMSNETENTTKETEK